VPTELREPVRAAKTSRFRSDTHRARVDKAKVIRYDSHAASMVLWIAVASTDRSTGTV